MKRIVPVSIGLAALLAGPAALAQAPSCANVQFDQEVLARFPNARASCLDIIDREGQLYAVVKADLVRTTNSAVYVRYKRPDGSYSDTQRVAVKPTDRVRVDGRPTPIPDLAVGQELTAYVKVSEPLVAFEPAVETDVLVVVPLEGPAPAVASNTATMPRTAGPLPAIAAFGVALLGIAGILGLVRRRIHP